MERGPDRWYLSEPVKLMFILDTPNQEKADKREFLVEGVVLNFVSGSQYLGAYLGPQEELAAWVKPQVEEWNHRVKVLRKITKRYPQSAYTSLGMLLQL